MAQLIQSYSESNVNSSYLIEALDPAAGVLASRLGIAIITPASPAYTLTSFKFWLKKTGSPTGTATAQLYLGTGSIPTAVPTGSVLASVTFDVSTLTTSYALYQFTFTTPYLAAVSTVYCLTLQGPSSGTIDQTNSIVLGLSDPDSPSSGGNQLKFSSGAWSSNARGVAYYLYGNSMGGGGFFQFL